MAQFGEDFDVLRWTTANMGEDAGDRGRDENNHVIWHNRYPDQDEWKEARTFTVDMTPHGEHRTPRNLPVSPDRPLDPYGTPGYDAYTIEDLVQFAIDFDVITP